MAVTRKARLGLGFEVERGSARSLVDVETLAGGVGQLSLPYSLRWLLDALVGLSLLHEAPLQPGGPGFVHGEVTPARLWLDADGVGKLVPLVPAHWSANSSISTEWNGYLAPEALLGDAVDVRADLYSIGVMLWEALAGHRLFSEPTAEAIVMRLMSGKVDLPQLAGDDAWAMPLATIAKRAISVNPRQRFENARELRAAIEAAAGDHLASRSGMSDLHRNPAAGSRRGPSAPPTVRKGNSKQTLIGLHPERRSAAPEAPPNVADSAPSIPPPPSGVPELLEAVDELLAEPVISSVQRVGVVPRVPSEPPAAPPAPRFDPLPPAHSERNDQAGFFEMPEEPDRSGRGALWVMLVLVLLLIAGGALAYPPVRNHPRVAGLLRKVPVLSRLAPATAEAPGAAPSKEAPTAKTVVDEPTTAPSEPEPAATAEARAPQSASAAPPEKEQPVAHGVRRAPGRKGGKVEEPAPPPKPVEAPAPPPPAAPAPAPEPPPPPPKPKQAADDDRERYGI